MTAEQKIKYLPAGGIAGFVMSDEQVEHLEAEELQEQYGTTGIAQFSTIGKNMANFGRHGDDTVAHVETGELIVPRALIENNPKLKESIFKHLRELGVEDPERYVVGESNNSLNPTTGLPEFFFKKLFRSVSKVVKGVGKALKKAAPIIIPLALNYFAPGLGQVYSAALGAGIGTLVQGGSVKDALKAAVLGGATGALTAGVSGTQGDFFSNVASDVSMGTANIGNAFSQGSFAPLQSTGLPSLRNYDANSGNDTGVGTETSALETNQFGVKTTRGNFEGAGTTPVGSNIPPKEETMFDRIGNYAFRGGDNLTTVAANKVNAETAAIKKYLDGAALKGLNVNSPAVQAAALKVGEAAASAAGPSAIAKYGPSIALATAAGAAGGMFDTPEDEPIEETYTGMDKYNENPDLYNVASLTPQYIQGDPNVASKYPYYIPQAAAQGGQIFPRRVGGIMPDEGIPDKDSVRAMLMPGEFVMTTDAVKGLGGGDMNKGINNMYGVMRNLEQRGRGAA